MPADTLTIAAIQTACSPNPTTNFARVIDAICSAAEQGARLIVLQELHNSLYFCQTEDITHFDLAEPIPGPSTTELSTIAARSGVVIVASLFERRAAGLYHNTAVVLDSDGSLAGCYRKMHIPDDPGYYEKFYFTPGDDGFNPINTKAGRLGVMLCWDQWFPEAARLMALAGAEILIYPTAIGWDPADSDSEQRRQRDAWITIQRSHAIANGIPVIACNRIGFEAMPGNQSRGIKFWGSSFISDPQGEIIAQAPTDAPAILSGTLDRTRSEQVRRIWPYLRDRRIDSYGEISRRYRD